MKYIMKNMRMTNKVLSILIIFMLFSLFFSNCLAEDITIKSISPNQYYDSRPNIWDNNIVWRRAINQDGNERIEISEPSWIMLYNTESGETRNITEEIVKFREGVYLHAESPDIWNDKIIYEAQASGNSIDTKLYMYNITSKDIWEIPIQSSKYASGHLHAIYGDWIVYTNMKDGKRQAYLYNYNVGFYRTIVGVGENYSVYGLTMNDEYVIITALNETNEFEIIIYDIMSTDTTYLNYTNNYTQIIGTSVYSDNIAISVLENINNQTEWNSYLYNIRSKEYYTKIENVCGVLIWEDNIAYKLNGNIHITIGNKTNVIEARQTLYLGDIYKNAIVWMSNENSGSLTGSARDNFDIYVRTVITNKELIEMGTIALIMISVVVVLIIIIKRSKLQSMV